MSIGIVGQKLGMTRVYDSTGTITPVTVIVAEPNTVVQVKTKEKDGYDAVQVGVGTAKESRVTKPLLGHFKKAGVEPREHLSEFRVNGQDDVPKQGEAITVTRFKPGQWVDVIGVSKGKGFQGVVRRHHFAGQPAAHGSKMHRRPGAIGCRSTPGLTFPNHRMPGHMGDEQITVQNLRVVQVREADNVLLIRGAVPGANGSIVVVRTAIKGQKKEKQITEAKARNPIKASKAGAKGGGAAKPAAKGGKK
jgi:large subunit ribosomal protein L3